MKEGDHETNKKRKLLFWPKNRRHPVWENKTDFGVETALERGKIENEGGFC